MKLFSIADNLDKVFEVGKGLRNGGVVVDVRPLQSWHFS